MYLNAALIQTPAPPVMEARRWLTTEPLPRDLPLLNLSQAAPVAAPPEGLRQAMAEAVAGGGGVHLYGPVLGNDDLRAALADKMQRHYGAAIGADKIAITSGCNQAFCATLAVLAAPGDEVILPLPWYFNHAMWLQMTGLVTRPLETGETLLPDPDQAAALITPRTRAIVLVTPNNPGGVEYPPALIGAFRDLCRARGIALILDETYRDFHSRDGAPHDLFSDPDWDDTLIHLYSFSKAFRLTGHRLGAIAANPRVLAEVEKFLDTMTICPAGPGQVGALWGLQNLDDWLAGERAEILRRRAAMEAGMQGLADWHLQGCGAYFAWVRHPMPGSGPEVAKRILREAGALVLPGTMFRPTGGDGELRVAFANANTDQIADFCARLGRLS